jgi:2-oxoglutarate ferredoxin oxidoreductase subunit delta
MSKVEITVEFCKGCGFCVAVCPKHVLEIGKNVNAKGYRCTEMVEEKCNGCTLCAVICPDAAIEVYR